MAQERPRHRDISPEANDTLRAVVKKWVEDRNHPPGPLGKGGQSRLAEETEWSQAWISSFINGERSGSSLGKALEICARAGLDPVALGLLDAVSSHTTEPDSSLPQLLQDALDQRKLEDYEAQLINRRYFARGFASNSMEDLERLIKIVRHQLDGAEFAFPKVGTVTNAEPDEGVGKRLKKR